MRDLSLSQANRAARNAATIARADDGVGNAAIRLYTAQGGTLLATRTLGKPCGTVRSDGRLQLSAGSAVDLVSATGAATWGVLHAADGAALYEGPVTDEAGLAGPAGAAENTGGIGTWVLRGTSGTQLYEGGVVTLTTGLIG